MNQIDKHTTNRVKITIELNITNTEENPSTQKNYNRNNFLAVAVHFLATNILYKIELLVKRAL